MAPFGLAERIESLVAGDAEVEFDRIVAVAGGWRIEDCARCGLNGKFLGAKRAAEQEAARMLLGVLPP